MNAVVFFLDVLVQHHLNLSLNDEDWDDDDEDDEDGGDGDDDDDDGDDEDWINVSFAGTFQQLTSRRISGN